MREKLQTHDDGRPVAQTTPQDLPNVGALLTPEQVADALGTTTKTLANWRCRDTGPSYVRIAGRVYYPRTAYEAFWLEQTGGAA